MPDLPVYDATTNHAVGPDDKRAVLQRYCNVNAPAMMSVSETQNRADFSGATNALSMRTIHARRRHVGFPPHTRGYLSAQMSMVPPALACRAGVRYLSMTNRCFDTSA